MSPSAADAAELRLFEAYLAKVAAGVEAGLGRGAAQDRAYAEVYGEVVFADPEAARAAGLTP